MPFSDSAAIGIKQEQNFHCKYTVPKGLRCYVHQNSEQGGSFRLHSQIF